MKKLFIANVCALGMLATAVWAGDTATVNVSATVVGTCKFNNGGSVTFTLDPSVGGNVTGIVSQPQFWCTKNATYTINDDDGLHASGTTHRMSNGAATPEYIPYSFSYTASGSGLGKTSPINMNIVASVAETDYINAPAGSYTDTVTLTINP